MSVEGSVNPDGSIHAHSKSLLFDALYYALIFNESFQWERLKLQKISRIILVGQHSDGHKNKRQAEGFNFLGVGEN